MSSTTTTTLTATVNSSNSSTKTTSSSKSKLSSTPTVVSVGSASSGSATAVDPNLIIGEHDHRIPRGLITVHVRPFPHHLHLHQHHHHPAKPLPAPPAPFKTASQDQAGPQRPRSVLFAASVHDKDGGGGGGISGGSSSSSRMPHHHRHKSVDSLSASHGESSSADERTAIVGRERIGSSSAGGYSGPSALFRQRKKPARADGEGRQAAEDGEERLRWWKWVAEKYGSVELDNKGSTARDHLALERTFLAWLRTSLAFASIGIAITQLFRLNTTLAIHPPPGSDQPKRPAREGSIHLRQVGKPLGATFLAIAILVLFVGFHRYFESQHWIIRGKFPASRGSVFLIAMVAAVLIVGSLVVVITVDPSVFEK